jgi:hypothetical protein
LTILAARCIALVWGLRMADSIYKEQLIETETKMGELYCWLLATHEKSSVKH